MKKNIECGSCSAKENCDRADSLGCCFTGNHEYASETCPKCGKVFCWACCGGTNVHQGGKYEPDFMLCPVCKTDVKAEN